MTLPSNAHAPISIHRPEPTGCCDRCGFLYPLASLAWQYEWAGPRMFNRKIRVCPRDLDVPQENGRRTIIIGPDPKPLKDPRPTFWASQSAQGSTTTTGPTQFALDDSELDSGDVLG